jgi:peroxiredoxin
MAAKREIVKTILSAGILLAIGFTAGFFSFVPIHDVVQRVKSTMRERAERETLEKKFLGKRAPDVSSQTISDSVWRLDDRKGKVVLLFFWASTCPYSRAMLPHIKGIYSRFGERADFALVGVSVDRDVEELRSFAGSNGIAWTNLCEEGKGWDLPFSRAFGIRSVPSVWVLDRELRVAGIDLGPKRAEAAIEALLGGARDVTGITGSGERETLVPGEPSGCTDNL